MMSTSQTVALWLAAILFFWGLGAYNRLVRLRAQVLVTFADVDQCHGHALLLVAQRANQPAAAFDSRFPQVADFTADDERAGLHGAGLQFDVALRVARRQPLDAGAVAALRTAGATLQQAWQRMPQDEVPPSAANPPTWDDNQHATREAVRRFNQAVERYNQAIAQFPAALLASLFGFRAAAVL